MLWNRGADRGGGVQRGVRGEEPLEDLVGERPLCRRIEYFRAPFEREDAVPGKEPGKRRNQERVETGGGLPSARARCDSRSSVKTRSSGVSTPWKRRVMKAVVPHRAISSPSGSRSGERKTARLLADPSCRSKSARRRAIRSCAVSRAYPGSFPRG